ncbi:hypothetical protein DQ04_03601090, partial [Trypanosoma grayi]|uniref:hypothetical protein n=1 Tax=Trypanosoma grayi TaxID=71804 RepID=UPI0004F3FDEB
MLIDSIPLKVKVGGPALDFFNLQSIEEDINAAQIVILSARDALASTMQAASRTEDTPSHKYEHEALRYVVKRRAVMDAFYMAEDVFHMHQVKAGDIIEEERSARLQLNLLHAEIKKQVSRARRAEYFMSAKCVFERFAEEKRACEEKMRMVQEHSDFLLSLKIAEGDQRQDSIRRAMARRWGSLQPSVVQQ